MILKHSSGHDIQTEIPCTFAGEVGRIDNKKRLADGLAKLIEDILAKAEV
ncbi:MAG TPA: hypothetical protein VI451_10795 [Anaerolineales bacterium]|nr:hypothetical protein [Anaerolineales bacterium]